jgi:hypothetical protein
MVLELMLRVCLKHVRNHAFRHLYSGFIRPLYRFCNIPILADILFLWFVAYDAFRILLFLQASSLFLRKRTRSSKS